MYLINRGDFQFMRIARIKFHSNGKLYDYLCSDETIEEGDVVYVEGTDQPVYVYEVLDVNENETNATSKVLALAIENPNVNLATRFMNIIDCKCECIVNPIGPKTEDFGNICSSIVRNAHSKEIDDILKNNTIANIFDTFLTDAGDLPSKNIIHIVMPFKKDDLDNKKLKLAYEKVIDLALSKGYESIAIPYFGTGDNGYSKDDVNEALDDTLFKYQYKDGIKINIVSITFSTTKMEKYHININQIYSKKDKFVFCLQYNDNSITSFGNKKCCFDTDDEPRNQIQNVNALIAMLYRKEDEFDINDVERPIDFVSLYRRAKGFMETNRITYIFGTYEGYEKYETSGKKIPTKYNDTIKNIRSGKRKVTKCEVFRIAIALKLNFTQTIQLMTLFSYTFNPISEENVDYEIFNFMINNNGFMVDYDVVEKYFYDIDTVVHDLIFGDSDNIFA